MTKRLYVGNLPFEFTEDQLHQMFRVYGTVLSTKLVIDFNTGDSRGFAHVEMSSDNDARTAIEKLNKTKIGKREIIVSEARPRPERRENS